MTNTPRSYRQVAGLPGLPALLAAMCLSRLAERMFALAIVLYVLERFAAPSLVGWTAFLAMAPGLLASPIAGALIDRLGAGRAATLDMAASALLLVAMPLAGGNLFALLLLVALYSLSSPLSAAGVRAMLPALVPGAALDRANALDTASFAVIDVLGPALCGVLFGLVGGAATLNVAAGLYAAAGLALAGSKKAVRPAGGRGGLLAEARAGLFAVLREPSLRGIAVAYSLYQISWGVLVVVVPVVAMRVLGAGGTADFAVGGLWALAGAASGFGAVVAGRAQTERREKRVIAGGLWLSAGVLLPLAVSPGMPSLVLGLVLLGLLSGPVDVGLLSLRQRRTDPAQWGRVLAVSISLNLSGLPVGSALGGVIAARSPAAALLVAALAAALAGIAASALLPAAYSTNGSSAAVRRR